MRTPFAIAKISLVVALALSAGGISAQNYPGKTVRMVTSGVGGSNDVGARILSLALSGALGQQVIVDNRPTVTIAAEMVAAAPPDGYVMLFSGSTFWIAPLMEKFSYDVLRDFSPVSLVITAPNIVAVHPSLPVKSVRELITLAKARPGELNGASGSVGSTPYLAMELFKSMAGVNIMVIPYKGAGAALTSLIGGEVQMMFATGGSVASHIKSGRVRALAVTSAQPSSLAPGLPTVAATGLPGYESTSPNGVFAPAKTPAATLNRVNQEILRVLYTAEVKERFLNAGMETVGSTPAEFTATVKADVTRYGKLIRGATIKTQ